MPEGTAFERVRAGIDLCVQKGVDVLVLSLGPPPSTEFDPNDPLQVATKAAYDRNIPVVVAAGNFGPGKLQALARAPWVISIGAVDADACLLLDSSTGPLGGEGPTLVSYGLPPEITNPDPKWEKFGRGTSFAAPRVAAVAAFVRACLRLVIADLAALQSKHWSFMRAAEAMMEAEGAAWPPDERPHYERMVSTLTEAMGSARFDRMRAAGHSMSTSEAVDFALGPSPAGCRQC